MKLCLICNFQTAQDEQELCPRDGSAMVTVGDDPLLGLVVEGRYRIESAIGQGSAGTVYKAVQELIGREVAIKVLHDYLVGDDEFIKRFTQEAKASSRLTHPNIITIYDFGVIPKGGRPYIAMDLLKGTPLSELIVERNHLSVDEALPIFKQVCSALAEAHRQGVVHRDIKPENIVLVERSGQTLFPIVVDFGIARLVQEESDIARITRSGTVCGSPTYMSPEQCTSSKVDHRSDQYSLGVVMYETLTGEVPFLSDELVKVMAMHLSEPPKKLKDVRGDLQFSDKLEEVVHRCLNKNPDFRYRDMDELSAAIDDAMRKPDKPLVAVPTTTVSREVTPGPLAVKNEEIIARKETREFSPVPSSRDLASRALEELAQRSSISFEQASPAATTLPPTSYPMNNGHQGRVRELDQSGSFTTGRSLLLPLTGGIVACLTVVFFAMHDSALSRYLPWKPAANVDELVQQGKLEDALPILQDLKHQGKLTKPQADSLNRIYVSLAKQYAQEKRFPEAIALLQQVPQKSPKGDEAKGLLKKYKAMRPSTGPAIKNN
jgi:serine/threonine protein kinase